MVALALAAPAEATGAATASIVGGTTATSEEWPWTAFILAANRKGEGFELHRHGDCAQPGPDRRTLHRGHPHRQEDPGRPVRGGDGEQRRSRLDPAPGLRRQQDDPLPPLQPLQGAWRRGTPGAVNADDGAGGSAGDSNGCSAVRPQHPGLDRRLGALRPALEAEADPGPAPRRHLCAAPPLLPQPRPPLLPFFNFSSQLCTITPPGFGIGTCHGDSGGPALAFREDGTPVQIGITSLGAADCNTRLPDIFTRVNRIYGWLSGQIAAATTEPAAVAEG